MAYLIPKGKPFELAPAGVHRAICFRFLDLGSHPVKYGLCPLVRLDFELSDELMEDGRPFTISKTYYGPNWNEKNQWRRDADTWLTVSEEEMPSFDMASVVGKPALLTVVHETNGKGSYANIASITPLAKGMKPPKAINDCVAFDLREYNPGVFEKLPERVKEKIKASKEWQETRSPGTSAKDALDVSKDLGF